MNWIPVCHAIKLCVAYAAYVEYALGYQHTQPMTRAEWLMFLRRTHYNI